MTRGFALLNHHDRVMSNAKPPPVRSRQFERAKVNLVASYSVTDGDSIWEGHNRILDLSAGGARISSAAYYFQGSQIQLRFTLPSDQREVFVHAWIVMSFFDGSTQQYAHGVAFTHISQADQEAILRYVDVLLDEVRCVPA